MIREEAIKVVRNIYQTDAEKEALETLIPELKESEDERIIRELIEHIESNVGHNPGLDRKEGRWIAWLEKQKEQKPIMSYTLQSSWNTTNQQKSTATINGESIPTENQSIDIPLTEWSEEDEECCNELIQYIEQRIGDGTTGQSLWKKWYNWLKSFRPQPKQEWSEEDKNMWTHLNGYLNGFSCSEDAIKQMTDWFYELPNRFNLHARQEWSEDTKKRLKIIADFLRYKGYEDDAELIESLRPQPHTVSIKDATKFGNLEYERGVKDGIQHAKNHQWNPDEEQMKALLVAIGDEKEIGSDAVKSLRSLYYDLKKLMQI